MVLGRGWWVGLLNTGCRVRGLDPQRWVMVDPGLGSSVSRRHDRKWCTTSLSGLPPRQRESWAYQRTHAPNAIEPFLSRTVDQPTHQYGDESNEKQGQSCRNEVECENATARRGAGRYLPDSIQVTDQLYGSPSAIDASRFSVTTTSGFSRLCTTQVSSAPAKSSPRPRPGMSRL